MELPYDMLYGALETSRVFIFYMGAERSVYLPKRAVSEEDCREIRAMLEKALQENSIRKVPDKWTLWTKNLKTNGSYRWTWKKK